jgi:hypothetical protein
MEASRRWIIGSVVLFVALSTAQGEDLSDTRTFQLGPGSEVRLKTEKGSITLIGWLRPDTQITVVRHGKSVSELEKLVIQFQQEEGNLVVQTRLPGGVIPIDLSVDYRVCLPTALSQVSAMACNGDVVAEDLLGHLDLRAINGNVKGRNLSAWAKLRADHGAIDVTLATNNQLAALSLEAWDGPVALFLPEATNAEIEAQTENGEIVSSFSRSLQVRLGSADYLLRQTLGAGEGRIELRSRGADIWIGHL